MQQKQLSNEVEALEYISECERYIPGDYEMEWDHDSDGWYLMKYSEEKGGAFNVYENGEPVMVSDKMLKEHGIDFLKCLNKYGCYVVE